MLSVSRLPGLDVGSLTTDLGAVGTEVGRARGAGLSFLSRAGRMSATLDLRFRVLGSICVAGMGRVGGGRTMETTGGRGRVVISLVRGGGVKSLRSGSVSRLRGLLVSVRWEDEEVVSGGFCE